jgi:predicted ATPase/DNA-binding XRE family transcriptional regulator
LAEVSFGEWLKRRRNAAGWTQAQLAQQIHCSTSALRKFESEERRPSAEVAQQIAEIFNIPGEERASFLQFARGDWFIFGSDDMKKVSWREANIEQASNLPSLITSFIGREKEQSEVIQLLKRNRLVTLSGAGGIGKTRLAIQVGNRLLHDFPHGVWFVPLDSLFDPLLVPQTVASVLDIRESGDRPLTETLKYVLHGKTLLLIFDNCEHLLDACVQLANTLLMHNPNLRILTTSREILKVEGEATYYLPSLSIPEGIAAPENLAEYESVQLFTERASLALSKFQLTEENARSIVDICRRVDGIPLAIELTAARVNFLSVEEISRQLRQSFALLAGDHRTTLSRHQTLQASLDWSWSLLSDAEQLFLCQLSMFAGGWTLEAADSVCDGNALSLTNALVQKSLIKVEHTLKPETRYHFHEMVRQYAREKLLATGNTEAIRVRHLTYFVKLVEQAEPELYRSNQVFWLNKLSDEFDNLRRALEWALISDPKSGLRLIVFSRFFWEARGDLREVEGWLALFLEHYKQPDSLRAKGLVIYGKVLADRGVFVEAQKIARQSLEISRTISDKQAEAFSLWGLGASIGFQGDLKHGIPYIKQSLALYKSLGDRLGQATALDWLSIDRNDLAQTKAYVMESLMLYRELGHLLGIAICLADLAQLMIDQAEFSTLEPLLQEALMIYRQLGSQVGQAWILLFYGRLAVWLGDFQQAYVYFEQSITLYENVGVSWSSWSRLFMAYALLQQGELTRAKETLEITLEQVQKGNIVSGVIYTIEGFAILHERQRQPEQAARLVAWADTMREKIGERRPPIEQIEIDKSITACLDNIGESAFSDAYDEGRKMTLEEVIACAQEES